MKWGGGRVVRGTRRGANRCIEKKWVIFRTIKGDGSGRHRTGSCTPVLRDFAKNGDFAHTGFEWRWGLPRPLKHAPGCVLAAERDPALGGSCTPVLRDFAKIGNFAHTGFERGWILPHPPEARSWDAFGCRGYLAWVGMEVGRRTGRERNPEGGKSSPEEIRRAIWDYQGG